MIKFAQQLQQLRKAAGYSQEQLADVMKVSRQAISKWESGAAIPAMDNLVELARVFDTSLDALLGHDSGDKEDTLSLALLGEQAEAAWHRQKIMLGVSIGCAGVCAAALVCALAVFLVRTGAQESELSLLRGQLSSLEGRISALQSADSGQSGWSADSPVAAYDWQVRSTDDAARTLALSLSVQLKETTADTKVSFVLKGNGSPVVMEAAQQGGNVFTAVAEVPAENSIALSVLYTAGENTLTQPLDTLTGLEADYWTQITRVEPFYTTFTVTQGQANAEGKLNITLSGIHATAEYPQGRYPVRAEGMLLLNGEEFCQLPSLEFSAPQGETDFSDGSAAEAVSENALTFALPIPALQLACSDPAQLSYVVSVTDNTGRTHTARSDTFAKS
ncbi:MAG: helix-turn-helix transcriptional regulator [Eubacteriales bacterium]|nr:helix-turn-helix transcriptional regulator [Eubacteriales bacterium]